MSRDVKRLIAAVALGLSTGVAGAAMPEPREETGGEERAECAAPARKAAPRRAAELPAAEALTYRFWVD